MKRIERDLLIFYQLHKKGQANYDECATALAQQYNISMANIRAFFEEQNDLAKEEVMTKYI